MAPAWAKCGKALRKRKRRLHKFVCGGAPAGNPLRSRMSAIQPAQIVSIFRYPVKGLSPEPLPGVALSVGQTLPADRRYAIENGPSGFDPADPKWMVKAYFLMLQRDEWLAALHTHFDDASNVLTISQNGAIAAQGDLETAEGRTVIERFFANNYAAAIKGPPKVLSSNGHSFLSPARSSRSSISAASPPSRTWLANRFTPCDSAPTSMSAAGRHGMSPSCSTGRSALARSG